MTALRDELDAFLAKARTSAPVRAWIDEAALAALEAAPGQPHPVDVSRLALRAAAKAKAARLPREAEVVRRLSTPGSRAAWARGLWALFTDRGEKAAEKFLMLLALHFGDLALLSTIATKLGTWPDKRRGALSDFGLAALETVADPFATIALDGLARRLRSGRPKQAEVAHRALTERAVRAEATAEGLVLRDAPRFGLEGRQLEVPAGKRRLRVGVTTEPKVILRYTDGKAVKSVPKAVEEPARAALTALLKQAGPIFSLHRAFVQDDLLLGTWWPREAFVAGFLEDPLRFPFAARQVWEAKGGGAFRALADGSLTTVDDDLAEVPAGAFVRLWHPVESNAETAKAWRAHFDRHRLEPVVAQLDRPTARVEGEIAATTEDTRVRGRPFDPFAKSRSVRRLGWKVDGLYAGGDPRVTKRFAYPTGIVTATLYVDGYQQVTDSLRVTGPDGAPMMFGSLGPRLYAQIADEVRRL